MPRSSTGISPPLANLKSKKSIPVEEILKSITDASLKRVKFDDEMLRRFKEDKAYFDQFRRDIEYQQHMTFPALINGSDIQREVSEPDGCDSDGRDNVNSRRT